MYCAFCGGHYSETEMFNASQRLKQDKVVRHWLLGYLFGGIFMVLFILPLILLHFVPSQGSRNIIGSIAPLVWLVLIIKRPFAKTHAKRLYPEKSAE